MTRVLPIRRPTLRAFTLIEVLIGILVLALGLLGLGAIIPVVVREQRLATDATLGVSVAEHAEGVLRARPALSPQAPATTRTLWDALIHDPQWSRDLLWAPFPNSPYQRQATIIYSATRRDIFQPIEYDFNLQSGQLRWRQTVREEKRDSCSGSWAVPALTPPPPTPNWDALDVGDRLWPNKGAQTTRVLQPNTDPNRPQFVWDVVARRARFGSRSLSPYLPVGGMPACYYPQVSSCPPFSNPQPPVRWCDQADQVQVAIFVRRIDLNIKSPRRPAAARQPTTLYDLLTGAPGVPASDRRLPVAVDTAGRPTGNGLGEYSTPEVLDVQLKIGANNKVERSRLILDSASPGATVLIPLASQIGQKLVDNLGNVYTCRGVVDGGTSARGTEIEIQPPIPAWIGPPSGSQGPNAPPEETVRQIVFTPQIPAAVRVVTITRPVWAP
ncbi:MAG: hypothetical protein JNM80_09170 [Phycisphaerae bacterium]|nr:hypothetical protein [Phycisphaerae bacterium]